MPTYKLIIAGIFCDGSGPKRIKVPEFSETTVAGFYTTRVVEARSDQEAMEMAANSIDEELRAKIGRCKAGYRLEIETCEMIDMSKYEGPRRGFTFFTEE
jgi:hypothetical protein